ncbi:calcium-binding protein [Halovulum sp. GXIMD14794]
MATIKYFDPVMYVYRYNNLEDYKIASRSEKKITLEWDETQSPFDPAQASYSAVIKISDATSYVPEFGPQAGERVYTGGAIESVRYFSEAGEKQLSITYIDPELNVVQWLQHQLNSENRPYDLYELMVSGGSRFVSSGVITASDVETGTGDDLVNSRTSDGTFIKDKGGADDYIGGSGFNGLTYDQWFWNPDSVVSAVYANMTRGFVDGPDGHRDQISRIDSIRGTFLDDTFIGDSGSNEFYGLGGDDLIIGRDGEDTASYRRDDQHGGNDGIRADLRNQEVRDGFGNTDTLRSIENIRGSNTNDLIIGNRKDNDLRGEAGDDVFRIYQGNDSLAGHDGADRFVFVGEAFGFDYIDDFDIAGGDRLRILAVDDFSELEVSDADGGEDAIIRIIGNDESEVYLNDVAVADVTAALFIF